MASYEEAVRSITLEADATVGFYTGPPGAPGSLQPNDGKLYRFVKLVGEHECGLSVDDEVDGVLQNKPQQVGEACTVAIGGVSFVKAGAADLTAGDLVTADANGDAVVTTTGQAAAGKVVRSGPAGSLVPVLLKLGS